MKIVSVSATLALALLAGYATAQEPLAMTETVEVTAQVSQIDYAARRVTLNGPNGEFTVDADSSVRNFNQIKVGDKVVARYYESIGADLRKAGDPTAPTVELSDSRAEAGKRPAGQAQVRATVPVTIVSVDPQTHVVRFFGADQMVRTLEVKKPQAQAFVEKLKAGDEVIITYTEAVAISVEPAK